MHHPIRSLVLAGILAAGLGWRAAAAVDPSMDPIKVGPNIYKTVFENDRVRTMEVTFNPGDKIALHSHPDHFAYALTEGSLKITNGDGKSVDAVGKPGQLFWMGAESHAAENTGKTVFRLLVVELKEPKPMMKSETMKAAPEKMNSSKPAEKQK